MHIAHPSLRYVVIAPAVDIMIDLFAVVWYVPLRVLLLLCLTTCVAEEAVRTYGGMCFPVSSDAVLTRRSQRSFPVHCLEPGMLS